MGRVFATTHPSPRPLVIKVLHESLEADPIAVRRLREEARLARQISHRNVVRVVDDGVTATGAPYVVMERAAGISLGDLVDRDGPLPLGRVRTISSQILSALAAIHQAGLVHGDIKSDNVLVDDGDRDAVTIIDFGLARKSGTRAYGIDEHMLSGTPEYMAPELARGEPLTPAGELYAVGVIVYEMLTGSTPFGSSSVTSVFEAHLHDSVVPPSLRVPDRMIPSSLEGIVLRALAKDPADRHIDAAFLATGIERAIPAGCHDHPVRPARTSTTTVCRETTYVGARCGRGRSSSMSSGAARDVSIATCQSPAGACTR
jgi:serine/threonine-protein kinase